VALQQQTAVLQQQSDALHLKLVCVHPRLEARLECAGLKMGLGLGSTIDDAFGLLKLTSSASQDDVFRLLKMTFSASQKDVKDDVTCGIRVLKNMFGFSRTRQFD